MLDIKFIRQNPDKIKEACRKKQAKIDIDRLLEIDKKRKELMLALEDTRAKKNQANEQMKQLHDKADREAVIMKMQELDKNDDRIEAELKEIAAEFQGLMSSGRLAGGVHHLGSIETIWTSAWGFAADLFEQIKLLILPASPVTRHQFAGWAKSPSH